jgi:alpha-amylase
MFPEGQYGTFLTNHDMTRVMTQLGSQVEKAKAAASLYYSMPGVPFVYYGEEIGMSGEEPNYPIRAPMQWSAGQYAGFSDAAPWTAPIADYGTFNVASETGDPGSLLAHYRRLISLRNTHPALRIGELTLLSSSDQGPFACLRTTPEETILALINLTGSPLRDYRLSLESSTLPQGEYAPVSLLGETPLAALKVLDHGRILDYVPVPEVPPYATIILRLQRN